MSRLAPGRHVPVRRVRLLSGQTVDLADGGSMTHLQFRRFAGCPVCDLHLRSFVRRRAEVDTLLREIIVFHSPPNELAAYAKDIPFPLIADPEKKLYAAYGAEAGLSALLHPRAWLTILRAVVAALPRVILRQRPMPPLFPKGGRYGLPADFLVSPAGVVIAAHYGEHAGDQWSVDMVLSLASAKWPARVAGTADKDLNLAATGQTAK
jgi:peroxiredoxin